MIKTSVIRGASIELYQLLKFEGVVASGGEAKALIADGGVVVNGTVETRKRKKITVGDTVAVFDDTFVIASAGL